ncbi:transglutaminase-like cysteine peptidase [Sphingomonas sp. LHG3406-1]|uniref:transglutaminase-like cysteine peptidase n=1 Tax=Sphingomonas sp. LHG3406-1 TaxID=2804617 RepID=UPI00261B9235|nr:transglutaminase-like cysteine peptidase [Sphingomonas sp. LHG3406-1]
MRKGRRQGPWPAVLFGLALIGAVPAAPAATLPLDGEGGDVVVTAQVRPNLFGTVAIPGPQGRWADKWHKVLADTRSKSALQGLIEPARGLGSIGQLKFLQAEIDRRVGWRSDTTQYGARTYWATAAETLNTGLGDDDDRAILKYQALRELGYPRNDYYLMMGRDRIRGDYVMLAARADGRWWLLEEQGSAPVLAEQRTGFEPAASFGGGRAWVHGRQRQLAQAKTIPAGAAATQR